MALSASELAEASVIRHVMNDGEQTTLRSAEEIIRLNEYTKKEALTAANKKVGFLNMLTKVKCKYHE